MTISTRLGQRLAFLIGFGNRDSAVAYIHRERIQRWRLAISLNNYLTHLRNPPCVDRRHMRKI